MSRRTNDLRGTSVRYSDNVRPVAPDAAAAVLKSFLLTVTQNEGPYSPSAADRKVLSKQQLKVGVRVAAGMSVREAASDLGWAMVPCHRAMTTVLSRTGIGSYTQLRKLCEPLDSEEKLVGFLVSMVKWNRVKLPEGTTIRFAAPELIEAM